MEESNKLQLHVQGTINWMPLEKMWAFSILDTLTSKAEPAVSAYVKLEDGIIIDDVIMNFKIANASHIATEIADKNIIVRIIGMGKFDDDRLVLYGHVLNHSGVA